MKNKLLANEKCMHENRPKNDLMIQLFSLEKENVFNCKSEMDCILLLLVAFAELS